MESKWYNDSVFFLCVFYHGKHDITFKNLILSLIRKKNIENFKIIVSLMQMALAKGKRCILGQKGMGMLAQLSSGENYQ